MMPKSTFNGAVWEKPGSYPIVLQCRERAREAPRTEQRCRRTGRAAWAISIPREGLGRRTAVCEPRPKQRGVGIVAGSTAVCLASLSPTHWSCLPPFCGVGGHRITALRSAFQISLSLPVPTATCPWVGKGKRPGRFLSTPQRSCRKKCQRLHTVTPKE